MSANDSPLDVHFSPEELKVAVEEGNRFNVPVMAHAHSAKGNLVACMLLCSHQETVYD
jgi:imidazolonepropionase-like amidohydrolase